MSFIGDLREFKDLRSTLRKLLPDEIRVASKGGWTEEDIQRIGVDIRKLTALASRLSTVLGVAVFLPLLVVISFLVTHKEGEPFGFAYRIFGFWMLGVAGLAMLWFWPMIGLLRLLRPLPESSYRELMQPVRLNMDLCNIGINLALMLYVVLSLEISKAYPIVIIFAGLWLIGPIAAYLAGRDGLFLGIRLAQLGCLSCAALFSVLSPVPVKHYQIWAQREAGSRLRPMEQKEITDRWADLQWFTQEGVPLVWYSMRKDGVHLFSAPGHDPETNDELKQVRDGAIKEELVSNLQAQRTNRERLQKDAEKQKQTEAEAKAKQLAVENERATANAAAKKESEEREMSVRAVREFVSPEFVGASNPRDKTALVVLNDNGEESTSLSLRLSKALNSAGVSNVVGVFRPAYYSSDVFSALLRGRFDAQPQFRTSDFARRILVIRTASGQSQGRVAAEKDLVTTELSWRVQLVVTDNGRVDFDHEIKERGVGFKEQNAYSNAVERAEKELLKVAVKEIRQ